MAGANISNLGLPRLAEYEAFCEPAYRQAGIFGGVCSIRRQIPQQNNEVIGQAPPWVLNFN